MRLLNSHVFMLSIYSLRLLYSDKNSVHLSTLDTMSPSQLLLEMVEAQANFSLESLHSLKQNQLQIHTFPDCHLNLSVFNREFFDWDYYFVSYKFLKQISKI